MKKAKNGNPTQKRKSTDRKAKVLTKYGPVAGALMLSYMGKIANYKKQIAFLKAKLAAKTERGT